MSARARFEDARRRARGASRLSLDREVHLPTHAKREMLAGVTSRFWL